MVGITQPKPREHVNADGVWELSRNKGKMTVFSLCLLLCADLLDLAVGKSDPVMSFSRCVNLSRSSHLYLRSNKSQTINEFWDLFMTVKRGYQLAINRTAGWRRSVPCLLHANFPPPRQTSREEAKSVNSVRILFRLQNVWCR